MIRKFMVVFGSRKVFPCHGLILSKAHSLIAREIADLEFWPVERFKATDSLHDSQAYKGMVFYALKCHCHCLFSAETQTTKNEEATEIGKVILAELMQKPSGIDF
jgi:hypothetical protein